MARLPSTVLLFVSFLCAAFAQHCEPFTPTLTQCGSTVAAPEIYIPEGVTQQAIEELLVEPLAPLTLDVVPQECVDAVYSFVCIDSFRECSEVDTGAGAGTRPHWNAYLGCAGAGVVAATAVLPVVLSSTTALEIHLAV